MKDNGALKVAAVGDRELTMSREFNAPRKLVWEAWTTPALLQRWLGVHNGWTFPVCEMDFRVGGRYRWVWRSASGVDMGMGGEYREIVEPQRIVATEKFDDAWYPGEAVGTVEFVEERGRTTLTQTLIYESKEARDAVMQSPMETGVAAAYDTLEELLTARLSEAQK